MNSVRKGDRRMASASAFPVLIPILVTLTTLVSLTVSLTACFTRGGKPGSGSVATGARLAKVPACKETTRLGEMCRVAAAGPQKAQNASTSPTTPPDTRGTLVRPTQMSVGFSAVAGSRKALDAALGSPETLDAHLEASQGKVVIGPEGSVYVVGRHDRWRALWDAGVGETYASVAGNFADLNEADFWNVLDEKKWVFPYDEGGIGPRPFADLPKDLGGLTDDPYRGLARAAADAGAFDSGDDALTEFRWAEHFRTRVPSDILRGDFKDALRRATDFAKELEAGSLPGFKGR